MKTKAAVLYEPNKELAIDNLEIPKLEKGQVIVKILYSGICGSQLNEIRGRKGTDKYLPHTLGHEGSGMVEKIGPSVKNVRPGDYVILTWIKGKGIDALPCNYRNQNGKIVNSGQISTFGERLVISENRMVKAPKALPTHIAPLLGCAIPTGIGIVRNTLKVERRSTIAIFGVGGIGLSAVLGASLEGCSKIIAVDIHDNKLELAKELGATHTINSKKEDPISRIRELTDGKGVDYAAEASGVVQAMEAAYESTKTPGKVVLAGNVKKGEKISIDPWELLFGKKLLGTTLGETHRIEDIKNYADLYLKGKLKLDKLITHRYKLEEINTAFEDLEKGKIARGLIEF